MKPNTALRGAVTATALLLVSAVPADDHLQRNESMTTILDFDRHADTNHWRSVDDRVMGGISRSTMATSGNGTAHFRGNLSLERNGGFASVRAAPLAWNLEPYDGLSLRVRGDGKRYKVTLKTDRFFDGIIYRAPFDTVDGDWMEIVIPFEEFQPMWRGRHVPSAGPLEPGSILSAGFMISDKQEGPFDLEIDWVKGWLR